LACAEGLEPPFSAPVTLVRLEGGWGYAQLLERNYIMPANDPKYQKKYIRQHYLDNKEYYKKKAYERDKRILPKLREFTNRYKTFVGCVDCGYKENPVALQFDHVRGEKTLAVSQMVSSCYSLKRIKEEIRKCEVRCANCHSIKTYERRTKNKA
jgi:hypothetical protein